VCASTRAAPGVRCRRCEGFRFGSVRVRCDAMSRHEAPNPTEAVRCVAPPKQRRGPCFFLLLEFKQAAGCEARRGWIRFVFVSFRFVARRIGSHTHGATPASVTGCLCEARGCCLLSGRTRGSAATVDRNETKRNETTKANATQHNATQNNAVHSPSGSRNS